MGIPGPVPAMTGEAIDLVVATTDTASAPTRRDLALARVARALAAVDSSDAVLPEHVRRAAAVLGLKQPAGSKPPLPPPVPDPSADTPPDITPAPATPEPVVEEQASTAGQAVLTGNQQSAPAPLDDLTVSADLLRAEIYPEDDPDALPEYSQLRQPWQDTSQPRALRGHVIGTEPTRTLTDIAVVPTALQAAKFQPIRRLTGLASEGELIIFGSDLRGTGTSRGPIPPSSWCSITRADATGISLRRWSHTYAGPTCARRC